METTGTDFRFEGFVVPAYTQVPDAVFDVLLPLLTGAELKVLLYVIRRTFGFKKATDNISLSQIMHGITTRTGEVLDRGTGLSKDAVTRAVKRLVAIEVLVTRRNKSPERGNEATSYALHIRDPLSENRTPPRPKIGQALVRESDIQETVEQETDEQGNFEASKAPQSTVVVDKSGDNPAPRFRRKRADLPAHAMIPITRLIEDLSRDLNDAIHLQSNISRAANLYAEYAADVDSFFVKAYEARTFARHQVNARSRMAIFFVALERELKAENV